MTVEGWAHRAGAGIGAIGYPIVAAHVLAGGTPDWAARVTAAVAALLAVVCVVALLAAPWWRVVVASANAVTCAFAVAYDLLRTPSPQWLLDIAFATALLIEAVLLVRQLARHPEGPNLLALLVIPALALLAVWGTAASAPAALRPRLDLAVSFGLATLIDDSSGHRDHIAVSATITVHNTVSIATQVAGSLYTVTAPTSASPNRPMDATVAAGFEHDIVTAAGAARALDGVGDDRHLLSGLWPTADPSLNLLQLDEITPPGTTIAPHTTYTRRITIDVPLLLENQISTIDLRGEVVAAPAGLALHRCPATGAVVSCATTPLPSAGPLGSWLADRPSVRLFVCIGDRRVKESAAGVLLAGFGATAAPTALHAAQLQRYATIAIDTTEATREVNGFATP